MAKLIVLSLLLLTAVVGSAVGNDYADMAAQLTRRAAVAGKRVAVIPFFYHNGRNSDDVIAKRLESELAEQGRVRVVECEISAILDEQERQYSGAFDPATVQRWGELLGAEAVVTGRLIEKDKGRKVEVNVRLIVTRTAEVVGAAKMTVKKDWDTEEEDEFGEASSYSARAEKVRYFEVFLGRAFGVPSMDLQFKNSGNQPIYTRDLGIATPWGNVGPLKSVSWKHLKTTGQGPVSIRFVGFGPGSLLGGALSLEWQRTAIAPQHTAFKLNGYGPFPFLFNASDYITVKSLSLTYMAMVRFSTDFPIEPYIGLGAGISLNSLVMPHIKGLTDSAFMSAPTNDFGLGFVFTVPAGLRVKVSDQMHLVGEVKMQQNNIRFDRGIPGERDSVKIKGIYLSLGAGYKF